MKATQIEFAFSLYQEHLEEASFLYQQRLGLFDDPQITWLDVEGFEDRFEAHIDGLVAGGDWGLELCKQQAAEGDFGELHAALRVICREQRWDQAQEVLKALDYGDPKKIKAAVDALKYELPSRWERDFIQLLAAGEEKLMPLVSEVAGYRRMAAGKELSRLLPEKNFPALSTVIWALGRLRAQEARAWLLQDYLTHEDESVRRATALALLRMGEAQTIDQCLRPANFGNWVLLPLGLGGSSAAVPFLLKKVSGETAGPDGLLALGLLGDISAVEPLLIHLADTKLAENSALALNLITGAEIYEQAFLPEEIDEDELFEEEREKFKQGQVPTRPDGKPFGITITRISQNPEEWQNWWSKNRSQFKPDIRYRNGKPYSPACLLENLESEKSPRRIRQLAYEELVIRYGVDFPFETDMFVVQQKKAIAKYAEWVKTSGKRFHDGEWYFAGQLMS